MDEPPKRKRRKGFPSETRVKRGLRFIQGGEKELVEKLGRNDPCPCGSGKRFQALLHALGPVSTAPSAETIGAELGAGAIRFPAAREFGALSKLLPQSSVSSSVLNRHRTR